MAYRPQAPRGRPDCGKKTLKRNFYITTSGFFDTSSLQHLINVMGVGRVIYAPACYSSLCYIWLRVVPYFLQRATQSNIVLWAYSCVEVEQTCVQYRPKLGPGNIPSVARRLPLSLPRVQLVRENLDSLPMCAHVSVLLIRCEDGPLVG